MDRRVVVYSAAERRHCAPLVEGFAARHQELTLDIVDGISVALDRRFRSEVAAGQPSADVIWSSAMDLVAALVREGHAADVAPDTAATLPAGCVYRDQAFATTAEPLVTLIDGAEIGAVHAGTIAEIAELLERRPAELRGRICVYDFARNGLGFLAMLHERRLRAGFDRFVAALRDAAPRVHGSNPPIVEDLAQGRAVLAPHILGSYAGRAVRFHPNLRVAESSEPAIAVSRAVFVSRHARNADGAKHFVDYLLSSAGQQALGTAGLCPLRREALEAQPGVLARIASERIAFDVSFDGLLDPVARADLIAHWPVPSAAAVPS